MSNLIMKFCLCLFSVIVLHQNLFVDCSGLDKSSGGIGSKAVSGVWSYFSGMASSILKVSSGSQGQAFNMGKPIQFETALNSKFEKFKKSLLSATDQFAYVPVKFPEASAFSGTFIRDVGAYLESWMDVIEPKLEFDGAAHEVLSKHILWIRRKGSKASTSYFIYRPSLAAEMYSSNISPHVEHQEDANRTSERVIDVVKRYPNDQIIFAGIQSGGIVATYHAWMVAGSVVNVCKNLKNYEGELHQVKIFLFDSDCAISETFAKNFPIPAWDILRFYSGLSTSSGVSADRCRFDSMRSVGFAYSFKLGWRDYLFSDSVKVSRRQFYNYFEGEPTLGALSSAAIQVEEDDEFGLKDEGDFGDEPEMEGNLDFDDSESIAASEISMSVDGRVDPVPFANDCRKRSATCTGVSGKALDIEKFTAKGIKLLENSIALSRFFFNNLKDLFRAHNVFYLRRNVNVCAAVLQKQLSNFLLEGQRETPVVERGIQSVSCSVESYVEKTKIATVRCVLESNERDPVKSSILFRTVATNLIDKKISDDEISIIDNGRLDEMTEAGRSYSSSETNSREQFGSGEASGSRKRFGSSESIRFDDSTVRSSRSTVLPLPAEWPKCLSALFEKVSELNIINPMNFEESEAEEDGEKQMKTTLIPCESPQVNTCDFTLLTQPEQFVKLYRTGPSMFFSIFSEVIASHALPRVCENLLQAPQIELKHLGNAEGLMRILNEFFISDSITEINHANVQLNGLEIDQSATNLPDGNAYNVFTASLAEKLSSCLTVSRAMDKIYDCNSRVTLWAGRQHCPEVCKTAASKSAQRIHLCSRVLDCGDGVFLGFRGGKTFGADRPLSEEFSAVHLDAQTVAAYYASFQLKHIDGIAAAFKKNLRFAVFMNEQARNNFLLYEQTRQPSDEISVSGRRPIQNYLKPKAIVSTTVQDSYFFDQQGVVDTENAGDFDDFAVEEEYDDDIGIKEAMQSEQLQSVDEKVQLQAEDEQSVDLVVEQSVDLVTEQSQDQVVEQLQANVDVPLTGQPAATTTTTTTEKKKKKKGKH
jgi:hypothetical protein